MGRGDSLQLAQQEIQPNRNAKDDRRYKQASHPPNPAVNLIHSDFSGVLDDLSNDLSNYFVRH
jgi:hypothetical protein